jgi:undecaprenyl-diphosphatase
MQPHRLLALDYQLTERLRKLQLNRPIRRLNVFFAHSGDSWFCLAAMVLVWAFASTHWKEKIVCLAFGTVVLAVIVLPVKFLIRRPRPEGEWGAIYRSTDPHSFPSGHAARVTLLAVMGLLLGPTWFGIILLVWAPFVCLARIVMGVHYVSDVLGGIGIGAIFGWLSVYLWQFIRPLLVFLF